MNELSPFTVYDASAGSGKTFTLVANYLSILLKSSQKDAYKNILAITFTNKAVNEMKSRIINTITAFTAETIPEEYKNILQEVENKTGLESTEIQKKSQRILKSLLHNYAAFEISTIDGFTHRILRTFAKDLGIPVNFEVELDTETVLQEAVDRLIAKAGENKTLTNILIDFAISKADDDKSWDISRDLFEVAKLLVNENNLTALQVLRNKTLEDFNTFAEELKKERKKAVEEIQQLGETFFNILETNSISPTSFTRGSIPKHFKHLREKEITEVFKTAAKWQETISSEPLYPKKAPEEEKILIDKFQPEIAELYFKSERLFYKIDFIKQIQKKITPLSLLTAINQEVELIKKERNLLLISEFNNKISKSIQNQPAPFIYERLGERYKHYFIDEFQDTSLLQWKNLIPLIDNSLASATGSLSLVGDAKQSIYRWRGGKAEQFMALSQEVNPFSIQQEIIKLPANYRSSKEIVGFNNNFFKHVSQFLSFEPYQNLFQQSNQEIIKSSSGYVNLSFIEAINKEEELEIYPQQVLETILKVEEKGYLKKDICILVRRKEEGIAIANYLNEHEIPIISSETLLIDQSPSVHFIVSLLQFSVRPTDANIKFEILDFIFENFSTTENHFTFFEARLAANEQEFFDQFIAQNIYFSLAILQRLPLYDAVEYIIRSFSLTAKANAYLQFFLDVIYEFTQKFSSGLSGFLEYWEQKKDKLSIVAPEGENAVQIMTIHKSKGLEFPIVIYPFANQSLSDTRLDNLWIPLKEKPNEIPLAYLAAQKKMLHYSENSSAAYQELLFQNELDALNVLYVALTRAEKQLYIISKLDLDKKGEEKINTFSGLFINYLKSQQRWKAEKTEYEFGSLAENPSEEKIEVEKEKNSTFVSTSPADHNLSIITKSGSLWQTRQEEAINRGELVHEILQQIITKNDVSEVLEKFILEGFITTEEKGNFEKLIENVVNHPEIEKYFTQKYEIFNEKEILSKGNFKRLDRLCLLENKAIIIDYKTGSFSENHVNQINSYAEAISEMNFTVTKKLLVYLNDEVTVKNV